MISQALILAAGRGVRMGPRGQNIPKGFIALGGVPLVARSLALLAGAGIRDVTIVTGHLAEFYTRLSPPTGLSLTLLHNPLYAEKGSFESLRIGLSAMRGDFLLLESDIVYEPRALATVLASPHDSLILASGPTGAGDEVYVWADGAAGTARFRAMSKSRTAHADAPFGELVGISKLSRQLSAKLAQHAAEARPEADYESAIVRAAGHIVIACQRVDDLLWGEIDDEAMLARVETALWPRILAAGLS
ncbi:MAG: phosphocholine cytidylyltransferase family protein [Aestuariivirga sp.]|uniref:phosphocholine cytidylyltransferase family protein n=1 Tax=Aestuariivirga sp. TaxID=2650926 RepID=UPI0025BD3E9C|nr:phosphocholine cytidylyltransferase family protein [Aestuariivirga sp.]MCA3561690.1 phosphocholine cytidylyltransferase family protein [Aestuariivirga sp.]